MNKTKSTLSWLYKNKYFTLPSYLKEKQAQTITTLIFTFVALSFFGILAISPTLSTIAQLQKQLNDSKNADKQLKQKIENLSLLQTQYNSLKPNIPLVLENLPSAPNVPLLIAQIQALARKSNIVLSSLQTFQVELTKSQNSDASSSFTFSLAGTGSYTDISSFISLLINFNRIITINGVSISQQGGNTAQLSLRGNAYFKK